MLSETHHVFGYPAVQRTQTDRWIKAIYIPYPHEALPWNQGVITEWHFYIQTVASADVSLQVWRPKASKSYSLVGQTVFKGLRPGRHDVPLTSREQIHFEAGDVLGIMFDQFNPIPYDSAMQHCSEGGGQVMFIDNPPTVTMPGDIYTFQLKDRKKTPCRIYSLYVNIEITGNY